MVFTSRTTWPTYAPRAGDMPRYSVGARCGCQGVLLGERGAPYGEGVHRVAKLRPYSGRRRPPNAHVRGMRGGAWDEVREARVSARRRVWVGLGDVITEPARAGGLQWSPGPQHSRGRHHGRFRVASPPWQGLGRTRALHWREGVMVHRCRRCMLCLYSDGCARARRVSPRRRVRAQVGGR